jgi:adenine-specific DNA-methyltransferase
MVNNLGQYFTTSELLQEKVYSFIKCNPKEILEPSVGKCHLVNYIKSKINVIFDMYEIDTSLQEVSVIRDTSLREVNELREVKQVSKVIYKDFLKEDIRKRYATIVGNPPYIKTKTGNLYIDFIKKCVDLLEENGELIFIVPSDFFQLKFSENLLKEMMSKGTFTDIFHPNNEKLFDNANIDIIVFRYTLNKTLPKQVVFNGISKEINIENGMVTFTKSTSKIGKVLLRELFTIHVGLVSGKESVFKNEEYGNIEVINSSEKKEKYIYINEFPTTNENLNKYLLTCKEELMKRKIIKMTENNWYKWGALRNMNIMEQQKDKECIYIRCLTRNKTIAFKGKVGYFGGNVICLIPKKELDLDKILGFINSANYTSNFLFSGRYKIGHRQLRNSYVNF